MLSLSPAPIYSFKKQLVLYKHRYSHAFEGREGSTKISDGQEREGAGAEHQP